MLQRAAFVVVLALLIQLANGAIFRKGAGKDIAGTRNVANGRLVQASTAQGHGAHSNDKALTDSERKRMLSSLNDITQDLESAEDGDTKELKQLEKQIVTLVRQRDAKKRDQAHKVREISFLKEEVAVLSQHLSRQSANAEAEDAMAAGEEAAEQVAANSESSEEAGSQESVNSEAEAEALASDGAAASASSSEAEVAQRADTQSQQQMMARMEAEAEARLKAEAEAKAKMEAQAEAEAEEKFKAQAKAKAEFEARMEAEAEAKIKADAEAKAEADAKAKAEAAAKAEQERIARMSAEEKAQLKAEEDAKKKADALADSADDSFKDFMKEEDGEDQQGDPDYEDSANALAGAIGWNRQDVEAKADSAVKQLTEAIGGKKVVKSLQGMMAGVR